MWSYISVCGCVLTYRGGCIVLGCTACGDKLINKGVNVVGIGGVRCRHTVEV